MNIILVGYRCTGKTAAGRSLAARLGVPFYDTDELIARREGRTVDEIVAAQGWPAFRELERAVIGDLAGTDGSVIALGGGAVLDTRNVESLRGNGLFVWLCAAAHVIAERMESDPASGAQRPSLIGKASTMEVNEILAEREPLYRRLADLAVDTTETGVEGVAEAICTGLGERFQQAERAGNGKEKK